MTRLLSTSKLKEKAKELRKVKSGYGLKAALYGAVIEPVNEAKKEKRTYSRKKASFLGHFTNNPQLVMGKDTNKCTILTLNPCKEQPGSGFVKQWGYCSETNTLKVTMGIYKYCYLHITSKDMKKLDKYKNFHTFYNNEIKGRTDCFKV